MSRVHTGHFTGLAVPAAERDREVYTEACASCHGADLRSTHQGPSFLSIVYEPNHRTDDSFRTAIANGAPQHHWVGLRRHGIRRRALRRQRRRRHRLRASGTATPGVRALSTPSHPAASRPGTVVLAVAAMMGLVIVGCSDGDVPGTAWVDGSFDSNGERIYFTSTSDRGGEIDYDGGPGTRGMMMGGRLSCASCHGPDAQGGEHRMHMDVMDAPNIRWVALAAGDEQGDHADDGDEHDSGYDVHAFRAAVIDGVHPDGEPLSDDMPRWELSDDDLQDLAEYLQAFEEA